MATVWLTPWPEQGGARTLATAAAMAERAIPAISARNPINHDATPKGNEKNVGVCFVPEFAVQRPRALVMCGLVAARFNDEEFQA